MRDDESIVFLIQSESGPRLIGRNLEHNGHRVEWFARFADFWNRKPYCGIGCILCIEQIMDPGWLHFLDQIVGRRYDMPVIFVARDADVPTAVRAIKRGAFDFIEESDKPDVLLDALAAALFHHKKVVAQRRHVNELQQRFNLLTPREREVCSMAAKGLLNKQIAGHLGTSERTVKKQRGSAMDKLNLDSVAELVRLLYQIDGVEAHAGLERSLGIGQTIPSVSQPVLNTSAILR